MKEYTYRNLLYIGDGINVSTLNTAGTYTPNVLTLGPKEKIVAMGIDPSTGLLMLSVSTIFDKDDSIASSKMVYLWDGISTTPSRKIWVDDLITAFINVEGQVYVGQGLIVGVWNGNGVTYLRKLLNASLTQNDLLYKHHMCNTRNILHVVDGFNVVSYGTVMGQTKGWFNTAYVPNTPTNHIYSISPIGPNKITIAAATNKLWQFDYSAVTAGQITLYFNNIYFPRPIFVRRVRAITTGITTTSGLGGIFILDENGNAVAPTSPKNQFVVASGTKYVFDFDYSSLKLQGLQLRFTFDTQATGFVRFIIYYDIAE